MVGQRFAGHLGGQCIHRFLGAGLVASAGLGGDQSQVGGIALVAGGDVLQRGQAGAVLPTGQLGQGQRGAHPGVGGLQFGGACKAGIGAFFVARAELGLAGQGQGLGVRGLTVQQRLEGEQGLVGLAGAQLHLGQLQARCGRFGHQLHGFDKVGLGLRQCVQLELGLAGQHQHRRVGRAAAQQQLGQLTHAFVLTALVGQHGLQKQGLWMFGGHFLQRGQLRRGGVQVGLGQLDHDDRVVRLQQIGPQLGGLGVGRQRVSLVGRFDGLQQVTLEHPGLGQLGLAGQQVVHLRQRTGLVATGGQQLGLQQQGRGVLGCRAQGLRQQRVGAGHVAGLGLCGGQVGAQCGVGAQVGQGDLAKALQQGRGLALGQHAFGQQRQHGHLRLAQLQRPCQLGLGTGHVAAVEQQLAVDQAAFTGLGVFLEQGFDLHLGCVDLVFGQLLFGRGQQLGFTGFTAASDERQRCDQAGQCAAACSPGNAWFVQNEPPTTR